MNYFDWEFYISKNKDLKANGIIDKEQALWHYKNYGKKEGRYCNKNEINYKERSDDLITCTSKEELIKNIKYWNWKAYKNNHTDLKNLLNQELLKHLLNLGLKENREIIIDKKNLTPIDNSSLIYNSNLLLPIDFDWKQYLNLNKDLEDKNLDEIQCKLHYILYGNLEERNFNKILIINTQYGLGNRLRALASAYSICKIQNFKLIINWVPDNHCDCLIEELIDNANNYGEIISKKIDINSIKNFKIYNYLETENGGKKDEYIDNNYNKIYVKSNCILNNKHSFKYFEYFLQSLKWNDTINNLINSITDIDNCIGMHIRMEGGAQYTSQSYEKTSNWTKEETELLFKYREISHIDNFINQINNILDKNPEQKFFIATDMKSNYEKLINIYGNDKIKILERNNFDRSKQELYYGVADIIILSRCKQFYGSYWSSFSELVTYFQKKQIKKNNIWSNNFKKYNNNLLSIAIAHKNRINNLINSINSYIDNDYIDDIVICDFNSDENIREILKKKIKSNFWKINIIQITSKTPYIASICNNIALYFTKNEKILKLDADNMIVNSNLFFETYMKYNLNDNFIHFSWKNAKNENEQHLNGIFFATKTDIKNIGFHNQNILFYGWEDCEFKERLIKDKNEITLNSNFFCQQEQSDCDRVINQNNIYGLDYINFFGFNIKNIKQVNTLILYNKVMCELYPNITTDNDISMLLNKNNVKARYSEYSILFNNIPVYNTNCNYTTNYQSICKFEIFDKMLEYNCWSNVGIFLNNLIKKYNITDVKDKIRLFYILDFSVNEFKNNNNYNFIFSLYNETNISRAIELLYCLKENLNVESIRNYYILLEKSTNKKYFIKEILLFLIKRNNSIKIHDIEYRPTYNYIFNFVNNNIEGTIIMANSDIVFDNSLDILKDLNDDQFISLTRYNVINGNSELIKFEHNGNVNILSQDTWIFKSPMKYKLNNDMNLGTFYCDSYMNYVLSKSQYKCFNLYNDIISLHIQNSLSESQLIQNNELTINRYNENKDKIKDFNTLGLEVNTLNDFINNINYNMFKSWDELK